MPKRSACLCSSSTTSGPLTPSGKPGIVLDLGRDHQLAAGLTAGDHALDDERLEVGARRVDGRRQSGGSRTNNDHVLHFFLGARLYPPHRQAQRCESAAAELGLAPSRRAAWVSKDERVPGEDRIGNARITALTQLGSKTSEQGARSGLTPRVIATLIAHRRYRSRGRGQRERGTGEPVLPFQFLDMVDGLDAPGSSTYLSGTCR